MHVLKCCRCTEFPTPSLRVGPPAHLAPTRPNPPNSQPTRLGRCCCTHTQQHACSNTPEAARLQQHACSSTRRAPPAASAPRPRSACRCTRRPRCGPSPRAARLPLPGPRPSRARSAGSPAPAAGARAAAAAAAGLSAQGLARCTCVGCWPAAEPSPRRLQLPGSTGGGSAAAAQLQRSGPAAPTFQGWLKGMVLLTSKVVLVAAGRLSSATHS